MTKRVLLADDDSDLRFLTELTLSEAGFEVVTVTNGKEVVQEAQKGKFDIILLDAEMPFMTGFEAYRELRSDPLTSTIPVLFLTASEPQESVRYLLKPFDADELSALVKKIIGTSTAGGF
jgi:DNA-binding response OmpR family regulator